MRDHPAFAFARPNVPGDAVSILVIVEDSPTMFAKWAGVRGRYLPSLLYSLRMVDPSVTMRVWWCTTSAMFSPFTTDIAALSNCTEVPDLQLGYNPHPGISTTTIQQSVEMFMAATSGQSCTRHCIVVASQLHCGPVGAPSSSQQLAMVLTQEAVRFHIMIDARSSVTPFDDLFQHTLYLQGSKEVPVWFQVDPQLIIRLSCAPEKRLLEPLKPKLAATPPDHFEASSSPEQYPASVASSSSTSGASTSSLSSLSSVDSEGSRPSTASSSPVRSKKARKPTSASSAETPGLVTILQQYHGLTKKRTYGAKPAKRSLTDLRQAASARPILPRLDTAAHAQAQAQAQSYLASYGPAITPTGQRIPDPSPSPTHTHAQASSLVERSTDDRRARRAAPYPGPATEPEYAPSSSSSAAALRSLEAMLPRLPEHGLLRRRSAHFTEARRPGAGAESSLLVAAARQRLQAAGWSKDVCSAPASPLVASPPFSTPTSNGWSPLGEALLRPVLSSQPGFAVDAIEHTGNDAGMSQMFASAPAKESAEDQPFVVTPEYEAYVEAQFAQLEAIRQTAALSTTAGLPVSSAYNGKTDAMRPRSDSAPVPFHSTMAYSHPTGIDGYTMPAGEAVAPLDWTYGHAPEYGQQPIPRYDYAPTWPGP